MKKIVVKLPVWCMYNHIGIFGHNNPKASFNAIPDLGNEACGQQDRTKPAWQFYVWILEYNSCNQYHGYKSSFCITYDFMLIP